MLNQKDRAGLLLNDASDADIFIAKSISEKLDNVNSRIDNLKLQKGDKGDSVIGEKGADGKDGKDGSDGKDGEKGKDGTNGKDGKDGENYNLTIEDLSDIAELVEIELPPLIEKTPEEIRDMLESLVDDERLDISAIKGLNEKLNKLSSKPNIVGGGIRQEYSDSYEIKTISSDYTANQYDNIIICTSALTVTLPKATIKKGIRFTIKNLSGGTVIVLPGGTELFDGIDSSIESNNKTAYNIISDGINWIIT